MADDIIYRIGADTSDLDAAMAKAKARMAAPGAPGSPIVTPLPAGLGGGGGAPPPTGPPPGAGGYWWQGGGSGDPDKVKRYSTAVNEAATATENLSRASNQAGINFAAMLERMVVRLVVFKLIAEAINGIKQAMTEAADNERLQVRFENLSTSAKTAGADFDNLSKKARAIGVAPAEWIKIDEALMKVGESAHDAATDTETLGEYAKESGESADALASSFEKVKLGTGTIDDMRTLVSVMGEGGAALAGQITALQTEEVLQQRVNKQLVYAALLRNYAYEQQQKQNEATEEFSDKLGISKEVFQAMINPQYQSTSLMERGGVNVSAQAEFMEKRLGAGEQQIEQEENLTSTELRRLEVAGLINEKDLLAAARRRTEAAQQAQQHQQEEAQAKKRLELEEKTVQLNKDVLAAVQQRVGLESRIAAEEGTQAAAAERNAQALAQMADDSKTIHGALVAWNGAMENLVHNFGVISGLIDRIYQVAVKLGWAEAPAKVPVMSGGVNVNPQPYVSQGPMTAQEFLFGHPSSERWKAIEAYQGSDAQKAADKRNNDLNEQILTALNQGLLGQ